MTKARQRELERVLIIRTLMNYGPCPASEVAHRANTECDHDMLDDLPEISPRGITAKLNAMSLKGLVHGAYPGDGLPMLWTVTGRGRGWYVEVLRARP